MNRWQTDNPSTRWQGYGHGASKPSWQHVTQWAEGKTLEARAKSWSMPGLNRVGE